MPIVEQTRRRFDKLNSISMDKGASSQTHQNGLREIVNVVMPPRKGRPTALDRERQSDAELVRLRQQHSAVKSAITTLEQHGLDLRANHGIDGFERNVAPVAIAHNVQRATPEHRVLCAKGRAECDAVEKAT